MYKDFSVLMSVYAKENSSYFRNSLDSILKNQSLIPSQIVLIVDGPVGVEIINVINFFKKKYNKILDVFFLKSNVGLGKALNFGLSKCNHEIIFRADSDDICANDRFETQLNYLNQNMSIDVLGGQIEEFEDNYLKPLNIRSLPTNYSDLVKFSRSRNPLNHMTVVFKKCRREVWFLFRPALYGRLLSLA